jgi:uncharacterized protein (UPF0218 family)
MSAAERLVRFGRVQAEQLMVDTCRLETVGDAVTDPVTAVVTTPKTLVYAGKCKLQNQKAFPSNPDAGEHQFTTTPEELHLPVTVQARTGLLVTMVSAFDEVNVDRTFRIRSVDRKSLQTALRCQIEEVTG